MTLITTTQAFSQSHPVWLCDIWGVVHNGVHKFNQAVTALSQHRKKGGTVVLISNSPRPRPQLIEQLDFLKVSRDSYDGVVSSGDVTRSHVSARSDQKVFHLGPDRDKGIFQGLNCQFSNKSDADYIVCSGLMDDTTETPEDYMDMLRECAESGLVMICANPDLKVQRGDDLVYCAGALAGEYQSLGGEVVYAGKPYVPIYDLAVEIAVEAMGAGVRRDEILAIGDGMHTDAAGAANYGCDFLFIAGGLHNAEKGGAAFMNESAASQIADEINTRNPSIRLLGVSSVLA